MGLKEVIKSMGENSRQKKEMLKRMLDQDRMENIVVEIKKSSNQRELEGYINEDREASIKQELEYMRKKRSDDIRFNHNALDVKNITKGAAWNVLKEKNMFKSRGNIFTNQPNIHKGSKKLLKSNGRVLKSKKLFKVGRGVKK